MNLASARLLPVLVSALVLTSGVHAEPGPNPLWASVGLLSGATALDPSLADYQWDTRMRAAFGVEALLGQGRYAVGTRLWRTRTTQVIDAPGVQSDPTVRATTFEGVGRVGLLESRGLKLAAMVSVGRRHLGYTPDALTIDTGSGTSASVSLAAVNEWVASGGLALEHELPGGWDLGLQVEHGVFGLDTAHRVGAGIETGRESFSEWNARFALAKRIHLR